MKEIILPKFSGHDIIKLIHNYKEEKHMDISGEREFELLEKIGFVRYGGTPEERKAADIIMEELRSIGVNGTLEPFKVTCYDVKTVKLEVLEPFYREYTVRGYGLSGSTPKEGLTAEFLYAEQGEKASLLHAKGKIVMLNGRISAELYETLIKAGASGFITLSGTAIDEEDKTDIEMRTLEKEHLKNGRIPGITMRVKDAMELVKNKASKVRLTLIQDEGECDSHNVIAEIPGTDYPDEVIGFAAHYDSVPFSNGVYDNGGGTVILMELLRHYIQYPPKRTLRFLWFGSEERGLLGSKYYVSAHEKELENMELLINIDMAGPVIGYDRAIVTADISLMHMIEYLSKETGHPLSATQDVYSSDSTPFADKGVPTVSFARFGAAGSAPGHNRYDLIEHLSADSLQHTSDFIRLFCDRIIQSMVFPVPREMPENMIEAVDKYLKKKKTEQHR